MSDRSSGASILGAAGASFVLAAVLGIGAYYVLWGAGSAASTFGGAAPRRASGAIGFLGLLGIVLGLGSLAFGWIGVKVLIDGAKESRKPKRDPLEEEMEYYKRFPTPKD